MQLEHILQAHGLLGRGGQSKPLPTIQNFRGNSNDLGTEIILNWDNPTVIEFQKAQIFMSDTDISNLTYEELVLNGNMIVNAKVSTHTITGLKHNDTKYFKAFGVFTVLGEEKVSSGVSLTVTTKDIIPPATITDFSAKEDNGQVTLTWANPIDSDFSKVKILYKQGSYPSSPSDGMVAYEGSGNTVTITGLTNDVEYYFRAFTYDTSGNINDSTDNQQIIATPTEQKIYGIEIDENNSNPETAVVYTDDAVGFTPARGNNGNFDWGSWESIIKEEFQIRPCVLRNLGGGNAEVNYYLDYDDYTKRADGSNSRLDGVDGDVMIEFGVPLWWKFSRVGTKLKIQLSTKPFDGAIKPAFEIEDGYNLVPFYPLTLTQIIYVLMFKDLDSQTALGKGRTDADSYTNTGTTNKKTFCYGSTDATDNVKFLGMEDYFGNRRWWIDGCYYDNNRNMLIGKGNFNDTGSGYENFGQAAPSDLGGYIDKVQGGNNTGLIPASTGGSATTYYCDYGYVYAGRLPSFGGSRSDPSTSGAFYLSSITASSSTATIGGRLFCSRNGKIYIGAYLGVEQNGKLRSISGEESANNKTIGSFRSLARANN